MRYMTIEQWSERLTPEEKEALTDLGYKPEDEVNEDSILNSIIRWNGGCASWYEVKEMIRRIYKICL